MAKLPTHAAYPRSLPTLPAHTPCPEPPPGASPPACHGHRHGPLDMDMGSIMDVDMEVQPSPPPSHSPFASRLALQEWDDDIWENLVAKHYGSGFVVESWMRGQQLGPYCPPDKAQTVVDARTLYVTVNGTNVTWKETQDHAKWGVALDSSFVVCVGDMNRMISQRKRGGGAVCFNNKKLCYGMYKSILTSDVCSHEQPAWARDDLATPTTTPTTPTTPKPQRKQDRKMKRADGI